MGLSARTLSNLIQSKLSDQLEIDGADWSAIGDAIAEAVVEHLQGATVTVPGVTAGLASVIGTVD